MFRRLLGASAALVVAALSSASAQGVRAIKPLDGYICMHVAITDDQNWGRAPLPSVYEKPSAQSKVLGAASSTIIVASPLREVDGFVQMLRFNRETAWIRSDLLRPFDRAGGRQCTPSLMSDNGVGFGPSKGTK